MKRVLVTGGAGLIGSHLCRRLVDGGHRVLCLDDFSTGRLEHLGTLPEEPLFQLIRHDVVKPLRLDGPVDEIYHLACPASPAYYQKKPIATMIANVVGTANLLELATERGAKFLLSSTSEVYGDPLEHPQKESYTGNVNPVGVRACYDEGKRAAEALCFDYRRERGTRIKVVRLFNTYGPHMAEGDGRVASNFIRQALRDDPVTVFGDGQQTRCLCYVEDTVRGLLDMMAAPEEITGPVNLGSSDEMTIEGLARAIIERTGSRSEIVHLPLPADDPKVRKPDLALAEAVLSWAPAVSLEEGLRRTISWFRPPLLSIIVPVYNGKRYLSECLDSILAQTFSSFEVLLVDDGSADGSAQLCDDYAARDPRIRVAHKENGGVSSARALGLGMARGAYIGFVDSDDVIEPGMYQRLVELAERHDAEIACCGGWQFRDGAAVWDKPGLEGEGDESSLTGREALRHVFLSKERGVANIVLWNKIYRRSLFVETGYWSRKTSLPHQYFEDNLLTPLLLLAAERVASTNERLYGYRQSEGSLKKAPFGRYKAERAEVCALLAERFREEGETGLYRILLKKQGVTLMKLWFETNERMPDREMRELAEEAFREFCGMYKRLQREATGRFSHKAAFFLFRYAPKMWFYAGRRYYFSHYEGMILKEKRL